MQSVLNPVQNNTASTNTANTVNIRYNVSYYQAFRRAMTPYGLQFLTYTGVFSFMFALLFQARITLSIDTLFSIFSWKTVFFTGLLFITGCSVGSLRIMALTVYEPTYPTFLVELISLFTKQDQFILFSFHALFNLLVIRFYFGWVSGEKYTSEFLIQPPGQYLGARQLNQQNIFVCLYAIAHAVVYTWSYFIRRANVLKINNVQQPVFFDVKTSLATMLYSSTVKAGISFGITYTVFLFLRSFIYYVIANAFGSFAKVLDSPIVRFRWFDLHLFFRLIMSGIVVGSTYDTAHRLFDVCFSRTVSATDDIMNPFDCLVDGLSNEKSFIRAAAFSELATISCKRAEKRTEIFETIGKEMKDNAWHRIMTQCFKVLVELRDDIEYEYTGVKKVVAPAPVKKVAEPKVQKRIQLEKGDIFATSEQNYSTLDDRTGTIFYKAGDVTDYAPLVVPRVQSIASSIAKQIPERKFVKLLKGIEVKIGKLGLFESLYAESKCRRIQYVFNKYQLIVWAAQSLGSLTAASLNQDPHGFVQYDIDTVLKSLSDCLNDVERYIKSPPAQYSKTHYEDQLNEEVVAVKLALREAIFQIKDTFAEHFENGVISNL